MATKFLIDGMLSGTGVRDAIEGGYIEPAKLGLSAKLVRDLAVWQAKYEEAHFAGFPESLVSELDEAGQLLTRRVRDELPEIDVGYFSDGLMRRLA